MWTVDDEDIWVEYQRDCCFGYYQLAEAERPIPNYPNEPIRRYREDSGFPRVNVTQIAYDFLPSRLANDPPDELVSSAPAAPRRLHRLRAVAWAGLALLLMFVTILLAVTLILLPLAAVTFTASGWAFIRALACVGLDVV